MPQGPLSGLVATAVALSAAFCLWPASDPLAYHLRGDSGDESFSEPEPSLQLALVEEVELETAVAEPALKQRADGEDWDAWKTCVFALSLFGASRVLTGIYRLAVPIHDGAALRRRTGRRANPVTEGAAW